MLNYEEMQYFAAFAQLGTLTAVAEEYHISQPTITRTMQKAEEEFAVPLFDRTKNRIQLNDNGKLAASEIRLLLKQTDEMVQRVRSFDKSTRTIFLGSAAAVQLPALVGALSRQFPDKSITSELKMPEELMTGLQKDVYQLIILPYDPVEKEPSPYLSRKIGRENLMFLLPKNHRYARRKSLDLSEMNGESMLLYAEIGFWADRVKAKMPDSRFLMQSDRETFLELIANSVLPCFTTDLVYNSEPGVEGRVAISIRDEEVNVTYYLVAKKENKKMFRALFES